MSPASSPRGGAAAQGAAPRVLMAVPEYPYPVTGGLERQAHELAKALLDCGIQAQAIAARFAPGQASQEVVEGIAVTRIPWPSRKWLRFLRTGLDLLRALHARRDGYDLIHLHQYSGFGLFVILSARILGKPILVKLPNVGALGIPGLLSQRGGRLKWAILSRADALVAISRESLDELDSIGFPASRILATPNGIRVGPSQKSYAGDGWPAETCRVVFVGRLCEQKLLPTLLHAWRNVMATAGQPTVLEIWGTGPLEPELRQLSHELRIDHAIRLRGHVEGVRERLVDMDVFVLPSRIEGNSNAILEAMAAGLPIVSTRAGGTPMLLGEEGASLLFDAGDQRALAANLVRLIRDPALRECLGTAMRRRIERHFDIRQVARTYAGAYRLLAAGQRDRMDSVGNPVVCRL